MFFFVLRSEYYIKGEEGQGQNFLNLFFSKRISYKSQGHASEVLSN